MVERGGLENRYVRKGIGGSNPSPSANNKAPVSGALLLVGAGEVDEPRFGTEHFRKSYESCASVNAEPLGDAVIPPRPM